MRYYENIFPYILTVIEECLNGHFNSCKYRELFLPIFGLHLLESSNYNFENKSAKLISFFDCDQDDIEKFHDNLDTYLDSVPVEIREILDALDFRKNARLMFSNGVFLVFLEKVISLNIIEDKHLVFSELILHFNNSFNLESCTHTSPQFLTCLASELLLADSSMKPTAASFYDPAVGTGDSLIYTANQYLTNNPDADITMHGAELDDQTYALLRIKLILKNFTASKEHFIKKSTVKEDLFPKQKFAFMTSSPPRGRSWRGFNKIIKKDSRFANQPLDIFQEPPSYLLKYCTDSQFLFLQDMISRMIPASAGGSRIVSLHNHSAISSEEYADISNSTRRLIVDQDLLELVVKLPKFLFHLNSEHMYLLVLNNNKDCMRKNKVQFIDLSACTEKVFSGVTRIEPELRADAHRHRFFLNDTFLLKLLDCYKQQSEGFFLEDCFVASSIHDSKSFMSYKIAIESPNSIKFVVTKDKIEQLRFNQDLSKIMTSLYESFGDSLYEEEFFETSKALVGDTIFSWCDEHNYCIAYNQVDLLLSHDFWIKTRDNYKAIESVYNVIGDCESLSFNSFKIKINKIARDNNFSLTNEQQNSLLSLGFYSSSARKVYKKVVLSDQDLSNLTTKFNCTPKELCNYGYFPTNNKHQYLTYVPCDFLGYYELMPIQSNITSYFNQNIKNKLVDSWMNLNNSGIVCSFDF